jgi:hypothetical protein
MAKTAIETDRQRMVTPASDGVIHWVLQGKGGIGKSTCSSFLTQYLMDKGPQVEGIDTDPINRTYASYKGLPVRTIEIMRRDEIYPPAFDQVVEKVVSERKHYVVDTGGSSFIALWKYFHNSRIIPLLKSQGRRVIVHTIVAGGGALLETMSGLKALADTTPERNLVVWINEHDDVAEVDGIPVEKMAAYRESAPKIVGRVLVPMPDMTYGVDLKQMIRERLTFGEAVSSPEFGIVQRMRLNAFREELWAQLDAVGLIE